MCTVLSVFNFDHWYIGLMHTCFLDRGMPAKKRAVGSASSIWSYAMKQRDRTQILLKLRNSTKKHAERRVSCVLQLVWMVKRISPCCSLVSHQTVNHNPVGGPSVIYSVGGPPDRSLVSHQTVQSSWRTSYELFGWRSFRLKALKLFNLCAQSCRCSMLITGTLD